MKEDCEEKYDVDQFYEDCAELCKKSKVTIYIY